MLSLMIILAFTFALPTHAETDPVDATASMINVEKKSADSVIEARISEIFSEIDEFKNLQVSVSHGVIKLRGNVPNDASAKRALALVSRVEGMVAVEDSLQRTLDFSDNVAPLLESVKNSAIGWGRAFPLFIAALLIFLVVAFMGHRLAKKSWIWSKLAPNPFLAQIVSQVVRAVGIILGLMLALNILGATALMGTILGGAGVVGLAISFGVKDSIENYICSIMLSIRQPFRAQDHVVINDMEGIVIRLTSRSTILMTPDGNHLRIPNAIVYKSPILNYTLNPQRRFSFVLGVDADDDPAQAMTVGLEAMRALDWILDEPAPHAIIETVGDSNIVLTFMGWVDQRVSDFGKSRSLSIRAAKIALEEQGFTLPEPIYRLRFDSNNLPASSIKPIFEGAGSKVSKTTTTTAEAAAESASKKSATPVTEPADVKPETHLSEQVRQERSLQGVEDLLDDSLPIE